MTIDDEPGWWRHAVIYQVYIRSFADGDGDGLGDIAGLRSRLAYLAELGVDAIWINPWYPSPMADAGYDVSDYRAIEPRFGTMADAEALVADAHAHGLRVLLDIVPNHTSDHHEWFREALAAGPGSPARERYHFRDGRGPDGSQRPNDWSSAFGGPAWTRVTEPDGTPGQWYLHLFAPEQPDVNWSHPEVVADYEATLRFWFDRGVDGFRIDVAHAMVKQDGLPDIGPTSIQHGTPQDVYHPHPHWDRDEVHDIFRRWRALADSYVPPRVFVAEAWVSPPDRLARYLRPDELHTAFNFDFLAAPWTAPAMRSVIDATIVQHDAVGASTTWVLSNHDVARHVSRYARPQDVGRRYLDELLTVPADFEVGARRARAAALLMLALPGGAYIYQGDELGLGEVEDLPLDQLQDPTFRRTGGRLRGRDGCRVPIPWSGKAPPFGFSPPGATAEPWLAQPASWADHTAEALAGDPESVLELYRDALRVRRHHGALGEGRLRWIPMGDHVLAFERDPGFCCIVNFGPGEVPLPVGEQVILASGPLGDHGGVPTDTAVWLQRG